MKDFKVVISILLGVLTLFGCHGKAELRTYQINNGTPREIRIEFYKSGSLRKVTESIGEGLIHEGTSLNGEGESFSATLALLGADSIAVIFDNLKSQSYYSDKLTELPTSTPPTDKNIYFEESYEVINNLLYRFTFTEEDYENAEAL